MKWMSVPSTLQSAPAFRRVTNCIVLLFGVIGLMRGQDCKQGFVWREAFPGDRVCVTVTIRAETAADNRNSAQRRDPTNRQYGPDTCKPGYVWRDARGGDHVCVAPAVRERTQTENRLAASRWAAAPPPPPAPVPPKPQIDRRLPPVQLREDGLPDPVQESIEGSAKQFFFETTVKATVTMVVSRRPFEETRTGSRSDSVIYRTQTDLAVPSKFHKLRIPLSILREGSEYYCLFEVSAAPHPPMEFTRKFIAAFPKQY